MAAPFRAVLALVLYAWGMVADTQVDLVEESSRGEELDQPLDLQEKERLLHALRGTQERNRQLEQQVQSLQRLLSSQHDNASGTLNIAGDVGHGTIIISHSVVTLNGANISTNTINSGQSTNIGSAIGSLRKPASESTTTPGFSNELDYLEV